MANTKQVKIMIPQGQIAIIQQWVDEGKFASITSFCTVAVEKQIDYQRELNSRAKKDNQSSDPAQPYEEKDMTKMTS